MSFECLLALRTQIINPANQTVYGVVNTTADNPTTVVWAPTANAGITLDTNAAGYAPYAGSGPVAAGSPSAQHAAATAPAPAPSAGIKRALWLHALFASALAGVLAIVLV